MTRPPCSGYCTECSEPCVNIELDAQATDLAALREQLRAVEAERDERHALYVRLSEEHDAALHRLRAAEENRRLHCEAVDRADAARNELAERARLAEEGAAVLGAERDRAEDAAEEARTNHASSCRVYAQLVAALRDEKERYRGALEKVAASKCWCTVTGWLLCNAHTAQCALLGLDATTPRAEVERRWAERAK